MYKAMVAVLRKIMYFQLLQCKDIHFQNPPPPLRKSNGRPLSQFCVLKL